ncbi:MAG TPA: phenylalanine 4-monooxygenase [Pyrinomonadaceae bacterium]|nr:phenylalanine 4-monooxygenase [Pyrinomonadaceae bacterium]
MRSKTEETSVLGDHVDMRLVAQGLDHVADRNLIVELNPDHPGFLDQSYRERRNQIAKLALNYKPGQPIPDAPYSLEEHRVWQEIWKELTPAQRSHACSEYLKAENTLQIDKTRIPQLREVSQRIHALSGFRLEPVAGLVEPKVFLESLADGVFLCTQYIRHWSTPLYTPEPDVAHEIIGHAITLADARLAHLNRLFGEAVKRTSSTEHLDRLSRIYWFTIEFGVLKENGEVKAYGTGLLSSSGELKEIHKAEVVQLDLERAASDTYDPTHYQKRLYCAESFEEMCKTVGSFLERW